LRGVISVRPNPTQRGGGATPETVQTMSPGRNVSTGISPPGTAMRVPGRKHVTSPSVKLLP
jgi:hypothetical protein